MSFQLAMSVFGNVRLRFGTSAPGHQRLLREVALEGVEAQTAAQRQALHRPLVLDVDAEIELLSLRAVERRRTLRELIRDAVIELIGQVRRVVRDPRRALRRDVVETELGRVTAGHIGQRR